MTGIQPVDAVVRVASLDGVWETVGADRLAGIAPENVVCSANPWGSDKASFDLRRDPGGIYPDLTAFTPVDIEVGGAKVWSGRVSSTPSRDGSDGVISVQCEGWQYHLDDDVYQWPYVHTDLTQWNDARSVPYAPLGSFRANGSVQSESGALVIGWGNGASVTNGDAVGVCLDLGMTTLAAKRVVIHYENQGVAAGTHSLYVKTVDGPWNWILGGENIIGPSDPSSAGSPLAGTTATMRRWVLILLYKGTAGTATETADRFIRITRVQVFSATGYESGNESILKASDVVSDALGRATIFLPDTTGVTATSFSIPEYAPDNLRTPREHIDAVNAYHAWRAQVTVDRRLIFQAQPSAPLFEAGEWSGCEITDASMNDGDEIYNYCVVEATGPDGVQLRTGRGQGTADTSGRQPSTVALTNPSFDASTTGWTYTASGGTMTRDTAAYDSTPASLKIAAVGYAFTLDGTFASGTFLVGKTYVFRCAATSSGSTVAQRAFSFYITSGGANLYSSAAQTGASGAWATTEFAWTPSATVAATSCGIRIQSDAGVSGATYQSWDTFAIYEVTPTIVDRRGFRRTKILPVQSALTTAAAQQIADTYLSLHRTTPYRGSITAAPGGIRTHQTGQPVHPATLLTQTQERVRLTHRINPDDGSVGRDGTIAAVTYDHDAQTASIDLDNRTTNFEAFLSRLSLLTGQVR